MIDTNNEMQVRNYKDKLKIISEQVNTNGYTEGTNNKIKVIKRNAFGYKNFQFFRKRIQESRYSSIWNLWLWL